MLPSLPPLPPSELEPLPTSEDYNQPLELFIDSNKTFSLEYPSDWQVTLPERTNAGETVSFTSPNTKKNLDAGLIDPGYWYDLHIGFYKNTDVNDSEIIKGEQITVDGIKAYRVLFVGVVGSPGIIVEHDGMFVLAFQPGIDTKLQDAIIQHFHFIK